MKKILASLLVLALCAPAMAATISITDNGDSTATITVTADGAANIVGLGLDVDVDGGATVTAVSVDTADFNIYPDAAYSEELGDGYVYGEGTPVAAKTVPGEIALPQSSFALSFANLNGEAVAGADGAASVSVTVTVSAACNLTVCENATRGGIVAVDGTALDADCVTEAVGGTGGCKGDITGDSTIDALDLSALIVYLTPYAPGYAVSPIPSGDEAYNLNGDASIDALDLSALVAYLTPFAPGYSTTTCMP